MTHGQFFWIGDCDVADNDTCGREIEVFCQTTLGCGDRKLKRTMVQTTVTSCTSLLGSCVRDRAQLDTATYVKLCKTIPRY